MGVVATFFIALITIYFLVNILIPFCTYIGENISKSIKKIPKTTVKVEDIKKIHFLKNNTFLKVNKSKVYLFVISSSLLFILTNPSLNNFREHEGVNSRDEQVQKVYNFLIFSVYKNVATDKSYVGFLLNFIEIKDKKV